MPIRSSADEDDTSRNKQTNIQTDLMLNLSAHKILFSLFAIEKRNGRIKCESYLTARRRRGLCFHYVGVAHDIESGIKTMLSLTARHKDSMK